MQKNKIMKIAKEVIQFEVEALKSLRKNINHSFSNVVKAILNCKQGKVIISGVGKSWPLNVGGKPNFTFYQNLPSFVPIMFECTVLFAAHLMAITYFFRNKLYPGAQTKSPDPRTTDDKFLMEIEIHNNEKEIISLLKKTGASEINKKDYVK
mgnify:CR=1 FL=1